MCPTVSEHAGAERWRTDDAVREAALEVEAHVAESGWDQPVRLYALVPTTELIADEPELAARLGLDPATAAGTFTPIEQELNPSESVERLLARIEWPPTVRGAAAVVERIVLPTAVEAALPAAGAAEGAADHPARQEVRMAAAVTRDGRAHCAIRLRSHDRSDAVLDGGQLVPGLVGLLARTLTD